MQKWLSQTHLPISASSPAFAPAHALLAPTDSTLSSSHRTPSPPQMVTSTYLVKAMATLLILAVVFSMTTATISASVSCFICSDCPRPISVTSDSVTELDRCSECHTTRIRVNDQTVYVRGCLTKNLPCEAFKENYYLPYSVERKLNITPESYVTKSLLPNVTHHCCSSNHCNSADRIGTSQGRMATAAVGLTFICALIVRW